MLSITTVSISDCGKLEKLTNAHEQEVQQEIVVKEGAMWDSTDEYSSAAHSSSDSEACHNRKHVFYNSLCKLTGICLQNTPTFILMA